jgi:hypothetical protein
VRRLLLSILSIVALLASGLSEDSSRLPGSIRGEVVTRAQNGEPAVSPHARIVLHGPVNMETVARFTRQQDRRSNALPRGHPAMQVVS